MSHTVLHVTKYVSHMVPDMTVYASHTVLHVTKYVSHMVPDMTVYASHTVLHMNLYMSHTGLSVSLWGRGPFCFLRSVLTNSLPN